MRTVVVNSAHWLPPVTAIRYMKRERVRKEGKDGSKGKVSHVVRGEVPGLGLLPSGAGGEAEKGGFWCQLKRERREEEKTD